jgi:transposase-like protein
MYSAVITEVGQVIIILILRNMAMTNMFLEELDEKHEVRNTEFLVDGAPWLHAGLHEIGVYLRQKTFSDRNPVEGVFQEIKRRTDQFYSHFANADVETVENWLLAPRAENNLI